MNDLCMYIVAVRSAPFGALVGTHTDRLRTDSAIIIMVIYVLVLFLGHSV